MKILMIVLCVAAFLLSSCEPSPCGPNATTGILHNATGLDGCGWVINLPNDETLEPINLSNYVSEPEEGMEISFSYEAAPAMSICMVGEIVQITCVESMESE